MTKETKARILLSDMLGIQMPSPERVREVLIFHHRRHGLLALGEPDAIEEPTRDDFYDDPSEGPVSLPCVRCDGHGRIPAMEAKTKPCPVCAERDAQNSLDEAALGGWNGDKFAEGAP